MGGNENGSPFISTSDIFGLAGLPFLIVAALLLSPRIWARVGRTFAPLAMSRSSRQRNSFDQSVRCALHTAGEAQAADIGSPTLEMTGNEIARHLLIMRARSPFDGAIKTKIVGTGHLDAAIAAGRGVVLWDSQFYFANVATKLALARAGYALHHMSSPSHGVSDTKVGRALLNPIWVGSETKNLAERVVVSYKNPRPAMTRLSTCLAAGKIVSVSVREAARKPAMVPFLDRQLSLGPGAVALAYKADAALIPVFTVQERTGEFVTTLEAPIEISPGLDRHAATFAAAGEYAKRLERHVAQAPGQWQGWRQVEHIKTRITDQ